MPGWADRIEARATKRRPGRGRIKGFSMPPFWSVDGARVALANQGLSPGAESLPNAFEEYVHRVYKENGAAFAVIAARCRVFCQANFMFAAYENGRVGKMFSNQTLNLLQRPWRNGTKGELLTHMDVDVAMGGNSYTTIADEAGNIGPTRVSPDASPFVARLRPDWMRMVIGAKSGNPWNPDAHVIAFSYKPPGADEPVILLPTEVAHYSPTPDPDARYRGMSWLTPVIKDVLADSSITQHKTMFMRNGAVPNLAVVLPEEVDDDEFDVFVEKFREEYEGSGNAYKTLLLAGGADVTPLSVDFQALDLKKMQGGLETRIAAAGGVHPAIVGLSEGMEGSTLNTGNYSAARRIASDMTVRSLWDMAAASLETIFAPPSNGARLVVDTRDIPFMREDAMDEAKIFDTLSTSVRTLVDGGWNPDAAVRAAKARDLDLLTGQHSGKLSVQLQEPGAQSANGNGSTPAPEPARSNGNGRQAQVGSR